MAPTRDRNGWDGVVLSDPPQVPGIRYPSDDDEPIADTELQYHAITDAVFALQMHLRQLGRAATVRGKCALDYDTTHLTAYVTPDVLLAYGVAVPSEEGYAPWVYGKVPDLVMEMASPSTHVQDSGPKWERYAAMGIPEYWQHDPHHRYLTEDLLGWQLQDGTYVPIPLQPDRARRVDRAEFGPGYGLGSGHGHRQPAVVESGAAEVVSDGAGSRDGPRKGSHTGTGSRGGDRTAPGLAASTRTRPQRSLELRRRFVQARRHNGPTFNGVMWAAT